MKILFVANQVPFPADNGVRIVSHNAMRLMREANHELALAVLTEESGDIEARFRVAASYCTADAAFWLPLSSKNRTLTLLQSVADRVPFFVKRYQSKSFERQLDSLVASFKPDAVHFDLITMAQYRDVIPLGVGCIASINDSYSLSQENAFSAGLYSGVELLYRRAQFPVVYRYEKTVYSRFDLVHVMSEVDANYLSSQSQCIRPIVIPNGVDDGLFSIASSSRKRPDLIFAGELRGENLFGLIRFLRDGWPTVRERCPDVVLNVVGTYGSDSAGVHEIARSLGNVKFTGYVKKLTDVYRDCEIAVVPINKNCGLLNKAMEGMAAGLAVVGFERAFSGLAQARTGVHFIGVNSYAEMGERIADLVRRGDERKKIRDNAHKLARSLFSWESRRAPYETMYSHAAALAKSSRDCELV